MIEVADILREAGDAYRQRFSDRMLPSHAKTMRDLEECRTPALGGQLLQCNRCGELRYAYHSCRNRHCPKCHADDTARWIERQRQRLLPCPYFLFTFTLPAELRNLARARQTIVYDVLLRAAAQALLTLAADPGYLGARPGILAVLHTWTRDLRFHPHVHLLVTAGGVTDRGTTWRSPKNGGFLVPCRPLSVLFRAKFREGLRSHGLVAGVPRNAWRRKWVVHALHAGNGDRVIEYLGRYVYRVALTNNRIESFEHGVVSFRYRDNHSGHWRSCSVSAEEFIRRFLQHVLPRGFTKVRSYGLFSPTCKPTLERTRRLLEEHPAAALITGNHFRRKVPSPDAPTKDRTCPFCHAGVLIPVATLPRIPLQAASIRGPP